MSQIQRTVNSYLTFCQLQNTYKHIDQWFSFGPQTSIYELSLALYCLPENLIKNP